jgi:hypothetical protein
VTRPGFLHSAEEPLDCQKLFGQLDVRH